MNARGQRIYSIVYHDNTLTHAGKHIIIAPHGRLQSVAIDLSSNYLGNNVSFSHDLCGDYLIGGVLVQTKRASSSGDLQVDEILLHGENKTTLEAIAYHLDLPRIPQELFMRPKRRPASLSL